MRLFNLLLFLFLFSNNINGNSISPLSLHYNETDTIDLKALLTYKSSELEGLVNEYYNNLSIKDTFNLMGLIKQLDFGDHYDMVNFDSLIQNIDWNIAARKVDWNSALKHFDWNIMLDAMCNAEDSLFGSTPMQIDFPEDSDLKNTSGFSQSDMARCMPQANNPMKMMEAFDLPCLMNNIKTFNPNSEKGGSFQEMMDVMQGKTPSANSADLQIFCSISKCINANIMFDGFDFNCMFENFDFNLVMRNWKMDDWIQSMDTVKMHNGTESVNDQFKEHPVIGLMNADSIMNHFEIAFEDLFDPESIAQMNQNFYDRIFGDHWSLQNDGNIRKLLELVTPLWPQLFGDNKGTRYMICALWLFNDMQWAYKDLDYETALDKQLFLKDILIYILKDDLLSDFSNDSSIPIIFNEDMVWTMLASVENFTGNTLSELGQHTSALIHFDNGLNISKSISNEIDPVAIDSLYLQMKFSDQERPLLLEKYNIDTTVLYLSLDQLLNSKHPKFINKYLEKGHYKAADSCYHLLKDLLFEVGKKDKVIPNYQIQSPAASKPYEMIFTRLIYLKLATVMEIGNLTDHPNYELYCTAPQALDQYQQYQRMTFQHNNLGAYYFQLNNYELSLYHLLQSWDRLKKLKKLEYIISTRPGYETIETSYLNKVPSYVGIINNIGQVYYSQKNYSKAIDFLEEAKIYVKQLSIASNLDTTTMEANLFEIYALLGRIHLLQKDHDKAWSNISKCNSIANASDYQLKKLSAALYLGHYYRVSQEPDSTLYYWKRAKTIAKLTNSTNLLSAINGLIGEALYQKGDIPIALSYYDTCESIARSRSQYGVLNYVFTLKGNHYYKEQDYTKALFFYEKGIDIIEDSLFHYTLSEGGRQLTLESSFTAYEGAINAALKLDKQAQAFQYLQQAKARTLSDLLATSALKTTKIPTDLRVQIQDITTQLDINQNQLSTSSDLQSLQKIQTQQNNLLLELDIAYAKIRDLSPEYELLRSPQLATIQNIRQQLNPDQAFIEYFLGEAGYAFVITKDSFNFFNLGNINPIQKELTILSKNINSINSRGSTDMKLNQSLVERTQNLYNILIHPIAKNGILKGIDGLIISPDQNLYLVPFELLHHHGIADTSYLINKFTISYFQSGTIFEHLRKKEKQKVDYPKDLLVISKSDFSEYANLKNLKKVNTSIFNLPFNKVDFLDNQEATLKQVMRTNLKDYQYIYVSTHTNINPTPELSSLALTKSQLSLYNTFNLQLKCDLMILSACQTAKGVHKQGAGVMGFTRGLMYAGAESVIISLWSVDDQATETFFQTFFHHIANGKSTKDALQESKLSFMKSKRYHSPFYWAAFVLFGE